MENKEVKKLETEVHDICDEIVEPKVSVLGKIGNWCKQHKWKIIAGGTALAGIAALVLSGRDDEDYDIPMLEESTDNMNEKENEAI